MTDATAAGSGTTFRVRMYRQGLGDCLLLSVLRPPPQRPFHMMIDCGVILGTPAARQRLRAVVSSVIGETGGFVDVLVVTHEHYDHVAGFVLAEDLFTQPGDDGAQGKLTIGEVWFAWTEEPGNLLANQLRDERRTQLKALTAMTSHLHLNGAGGAASPSLTSALNFFGVDSDGSGIGVTAQAMANASGFVQPGQIRYPKPGAVLAPQQAPELRLYVLGPPMDRASLKRTDSVAEVYHLDADNVTAAVSVTAGVGDGSPGHSLSSPFGSSWALPLGELADGKGGCSDAAFFATRYFGPDPVEPDKDTSWRRVDGAWLANSEALALALDSATNNTSLVLAVEIVGSGKVLLFPADAQVGNWLSWQDLSWGSDQDKVTAQDLLHRTVFYKVGHHGSHNATLRAKGLELMPGTGLVAFIPVDHEMAVKKGWAQMPLPALISALTERCGNLLVRLDVDLVGAFPPGVSQGGEGVQFGSLYFDWTMPS